MPHNLTHKRAGNRSSITKLLNKIKGIVEDNSIDRDLKIHELDKKLADLHNKLKTLQSFDEQIQDSISSDDIEAEIENADTFNSNAFDARDRAEFVLSKLRMEVAAHQTVVPSPASTQPTDGGVNHALTHSQMSNLPKFELPEFNGDILMWQSFWDVFEAEVHCKTHYSDATKFIFLNSRLKGEAKSTLAGLAPNNANYPKAIDLLNERYGQPKKVVAAHMRALYYLTKPGSDRASLRSFSDKLESLIRGLDALGKGVDTYGDLLVCILLDKLNQDVRKNLFRQHGATEWSLDELRTALKREIEILEDGSNQQQFSLKPNLSKKTVVLFSGAKQSAKKRRCPFCTGDHFPTQCTEVSDPQERMKVARVKKLCFNCLTGGSHSFAKDCQSTHKCRICGKAHHSSLHVYNQESSSGTSASVATTSASDNSSGSSQVTVATSLSGFASSFQPFVFLKTAIAMVRSKSIQLKANILIDEGAQRSFITAKLAKQLRLQPLWREFLLLSGLLIRKGESNYYDVTQLAVLGKNGVPIVIDAVILDQLIDPLEDPHRRLVSSLPYLKNMTLAHPANDDELFSVDILIGANFYWDIVGDKIIRGPGPTAVSSPLGFLLSGPLSGESSSNNERSIGIHVALVEKFDLERFWSLEALGVQPELDSIRSTDYYQTHCVELRQDRFCARFPWKMDHPELDSNFIVCEKRTRATVRKLSKQSGELEKYDNIIRDQLKSGFVEKVPANEVSKPNVHYVPHFGVAKESSTTPLRIVNDYSCKTLAGVSLNDCLEVGPPLQNDMLAIMIRDRVYVIGLAADIEKAFHQVILHEDDRDYTRFLWLSDPKNPESQFETFRSRVVPFGARCSPFILLSVIKKLLQQHSSMIATNMDINIYVDNLITGCDTEKEALEYYYEANSILRKAGLELKSWGSNSHSVEKKASIDGIVDSSPITKILGLLWNRPTDQLQLPSFELSAFCHSKTTKREVLRGISTVFDPLGVISPLTIPAKILIQDLWKEKFEWDDPLPAIYQERWSGIAHAIENVKVSFRRSYFKSKKDVHELHIFVDASQRAYGAVAYFRNDNQVVFVLSKTRVAPLKGEKGLTLPQLELMAAFIGTRLAITIIDALKPIGIGLSINMWSDSQIVLYWLSNSQRNKSQFVSNRVEKIQDFNKFNSVSWHYCPSKDNPADMLSRGVTLAQYNASILWLNGPTWLINREDWPTWEGAAKIARIFHVADIPTIVPDSTISIESWNISNIIDVSRYRWTSLIRVTAHIRRLCNNLKIKEKSLKKIGPLTAIELQAAENIWIQSVQNRYFPMELAYLQEKKGHRPPLVSQLDLFLKDGLILCKGRLQNAQISSSAKHPILLPKKSEITSLIVQYHHEKMLHSGVGSTVCSIRQRYWIPAIRQQVKNVLRQCSKCRRVDGPSYAAPNHAPLPFVRVNESHPFATTGVDYTGSYTVRGFSDQPDFKVYICLFTCATSRAVHLEVVDSLSVDSFLQAFRCFTAHHSLPQLMISDNASTFESAAVILKKLFRDPKISNYLSNRQVEWRFIPKRAPWYGGFWERLIGLTKIALKKMLGRTKLTLSELRALVAEVEVVINDRPLSVVTSDIDEEPLTPSHLLYGRRLSTLPYDRESSAEDIADPTFGEKPSELSKKVLRLQKIKNAFWKRWSRDYLTSLREYHQPTRSGINNIIKVGDVVLVHDDCPRIDWKLAVIEKLIVSQDGAVRAAEIRTSHGKTNRPITKLYPLEVTDSSESPPVEAQAESTPARTTRKAAAAARIRIQEQAAI